MPTVTWKMADGAEITAEVAVGESLMNAALDNDVPYVLGECGGCLACATCHVVVDDAWRDKTGERDDTEASMLEFTEVESTPGSRLSCQITMTEELHGLVLHVPE